MGFDILGENEAYFLRYLAFCFQNFTTIFSIANLIFQSSNLRNLSKIREKLGEKRQKFGKPLSFWLF